MTLNIPSFCKMSEKEKEKELAKGYKLIEELAPDLDLYPHNLVESTRETLTKNYYSAVSVFENIVNEYPDDYKAVFGLGRVFYFGYNLNEYGAWDSSRFYLQKAIYLKKDDPDAYEAIGRLYADNGRHSRAIQNLFRALKYEKNNKNLFNIYWNMAFAYYGMSNPLAAYYYSGKVLQLSPDNEEMIKIRGIYKSKLFISVPVDIDISDTNLKYKNYEFKFECVFPLDWDIVRDAYEWTDVFTEKSSAYLDISLPQAPIKGSGEADNLFSIHAFAAKGTLEKMVEVIHKEFGIPIIDLKEVQEPILKGSKEYTYTITDNNKTRKVYEVICESKSGFKYMIYHSAVSDKYDEGQKIFKDYVSSIKFLEWIRREDH